MTGHRGSVSSPNVRREDLSPVCPLPSDAIEKHIKGSADDYTEEKRQRNEDRNHGCDHEGSKLHPPKTIPNSGRTPVFHGLRSISLSRVSRWIKKTARPELPTEPFYLSENGAYVLPGSVLIRQIANFLDQFSADRLGHSFPRLHGLFSELCSFRHRIRLVWQRGGNRPLQMGWLHRVDPQSGKVVENTRTQARTRDIGRLKDECPWMSCEDAYLFLLGWDFGWDLGFDLGWESNAHNRENTETSADSKNSFDSFGKTPRRGNLTPRLAVPQSTKCDRQSLLPSRE